MPTKRSVAIADQPEVAARTLVDLGITTLLALVCLGLGLPPHLFRAGRHEPRRGVARPP